MAKQVLDLYKLYKLVTEKGGLVEVINKKIWREITKGLNLPTSITSAAFTLRTQYVLLFFFLNKITLLSSQYNAYVQTRLFHVGIWSTCTRLSVRRRVWVLQESYRLPSTVTAERADVPVTPTAFIATRPPQDLLLMPSSPHPTFKLLRLVTMASMRWSAQI